jgi:hypothetical protein
MQKPIFRRIDLVPFFLCLFLGLYFFSFNVIGLKFTHYPGDLGDGRLNNYFLEHAHKFLSQHERDLWNAPFMYPEKEVLSYSDNLLGTAPLYSIFRILNFDRETSFQLWFILMAVLSYLTCFLLLKTLFKNSSAAAFGAMIFAFSMALQSQLTHAQTFPRFPIPLSFLMLLLFSRGFKPIYFFLALLVLVYQLYCGIYLGFMLMVPVSIMLLLIITFYWDKLKISLKSLKWLSSIFLYLMLSIIIVLPLIWPYYLRSKQMALNSYEIVFPSIPKLSSHFFSQEGSLVWDFLSKFNQGIPAYWDHQIFAGGLATIGLISFFALIFLCPIFKNRIQKPSFNRELLILALTAMTTFILFIRIGSFSFYKILYYLPGFASMRSITRIINVELVFFAIAATFFASILLEKYRKSSMFLFIALVSIFILDNYYKEGKSYRSEKAITQARVNALIGKMRNIPEKSIVSYEPPDGKDDYVAYQIDAMLSSQALNLVCVNAYTATSPGTYTNYWFNLDSISRESWFKAKNITGYKVYIIH